MSSKWFVTPSLRVATFSHYNKLGEDVLVETDLKTKLCRHGELSSSIRTWVQLEAKARAEGAEPFKRPSACDCVVTHGLQNHTRTRPPSPPACMYAVLASNEAKELDVGEAQGPALQLPGRAVYLAPSGTFFCQHKTRLARSPRRFDRTSSKPSAASATARSRSRGARPSSRSRAS